MVRVTALSPRNRVPRCKLGCTLVSTPRSSDGADLPPRIVLLELAVPLLNTLAPNAALESTSMFNRHPVCVCDLAADSVASIADLDLAGTLPVGKVQERRTPAVHRDSAEPRKRLQPRETVRTSPKSEEVVASAPRVDPSRAWSLQ